jgi:hypothetical protein
MFAAMRAGLASRLSVCLLAALLVLLGIGRSSATTLVRLSFPQLAQASERVVVGTVVALESTRDESGRFIHTNVRIAVERHLRGRGPAEIVVRTPGGQIDGEAVIAQGAPSFTVGEKVLLFLTRWENDGALKVTGYVQGKSTVTVGADGKARLRGGLVDGRSLAGVADELSGKAAMVPLVPAGSTGAPR